MDLLRNGRPRVVITGMSALSALGKLNDMWESLINGQSGIKQLQNTKTDHLDVKIGGEVKQFDPTDYINKKDARRMGRASHLAIAGAMDALVHAGISEEELVNNPGSAGTMIGTSLGPQETSEEATTRYRADETKQPSPLPFMNSLPNMPAFYISQLCKIYGTYNTITAACASGTQAIGMATDMIRSGRAAIMVAGAVESLMTDYMVGAFTMLKALAEGYNDNPEAASQPFDLNRKGFVISEGCGIVILESLSHALKRGATLYAEVLGYASSADAYHIAAIDPSGRGAIHAMQWALDDAHINAKDVDYINAHGTSTKYNDEIETKAIKQVLGEHAYEIPISSTKSMLGHALGASGALEIIACTEMLNTKIIPPTINYTTPDPECDLDYVPNTAREVSKLDVVLSNSFGLGGQNATVVLGAI